MINILTLRQALEHLTVTVQFIVTL